MFTTPFQTTPCARFVLDKIAAGIRRLEIDRRLIAPEGMPSGILAVPPGVIEFQPFHQPLTRHEIPSLEAEVVIDGRSLLRADQTPAKLDAWGHAVLTAVLTKAWMSDPAFHRDLLNAGDIAGKVFVAWVSGAIGLRLGLDFGQIALVRACSAIYYIQLFGPLTEHSSPSDTDRLLVRACRYLPGVDAHTLSTAVGTIPPLNNITDFVAWIKQVLNSPRSEQLTVALLYIALGFSFGPAYRESVAVALEYPPVFSALVYTAMKERSYSKTGLGTVIERLGQRGNDRDFPRNIDHLISSR